MKTRTKYIGRLRYPVGVQGTVSCELVYWSWFSLASGYGVKVGRGSTANAVICSWGWMKTLAVMLTWWKVPF